jgi:hypothetical protein
MPQKRSILAKNAVTRLRTAVLENSTSIDVRPITALGYLLHKRSPAFLRHCWPVSLALVTRALPGWPNLTG